MVVFGDKAGCGRWMKALIPSLLHSWFLSSHTCSMMKKCLMTLLKRRMRPIGMTSQAYFCLLLGLNLVPSAPAFRFVDGVARPGPSSSALSHQDRTTNHHSGLIKQAYSAWVLPNPHARPQKWHLTAYFTYTELSYLPVIEQDSLLRTIIVPAGIYRTGKARTRGDDDEGNGNRSPHGSQSQNLLPPLSTIHPDIRTHPSGSLPTRTVGTRLPEDQRLIQMLNSRHVK